MTVEPGKVPLTYKGVQVGEAEVEFSDRGVEIKGTIYDPEKAVEILGPSIEHVHSDSASTSAVSFRVVLRTN